MTQILRIERKIDVGARPAWPSKNHD